MPTNLENSAVAKGLEKGSFHPIPKKGNTKECSNYRTIALISHANKVMLKILQDRLQQYVNRELPDGQAGFRKGRGTRDQIANIHWIIEEARKFQKNIYFCFIQFSSVDQSCLTLCDPMDSSLPGSAVHGIFQARILEWTAISSSSGSS